MELHQVRCFVAVAEELHFGRAAVRLHMTQPPLSRQIQLLERALGVLLLERSERQVRLSPAGQRFLQDARHILKMTELAGQSARRFALGESGRLIVGFTATSGYIMIPRLLAHVGTQLPGVAFELIEQVSSSQIEALEAGLLDVGFVRQVVPNGRLQYNLVSSEPFVAAVPRKHALAQQERLRPDDFDRQPFLTYNSTEGRYFHDRVASLFARNDVSPRYVHQLAQTHSILGLVNAGQGCALVPASAQALRMSNVVFRPLDGTELRAETFLTCRRDSGNPVLPFFMEITRRFFLDHIDDFSNDRSASDACNSEQRVLSRYSARKQSVVKQRLDGRS